MLSVCCNARPFEVTDLEELEGICNKCRKKTMFYKDDDDLMDEWNQRASKIIETNKKNPIEEVIKSLVCGWDMFTKDILGEEIKEENNV